MSEFDVQLINVTKEFFTREGKVKAVDNVNLQVKHGEFFALVGPSGCGKTTTLRLIAGFENTTSGQILIQDRPVHDVPPFHRPVNTVFQDYALFPHMSALQNVMFGLRKERISKSESRDKAMQALEMMQLPQVADRRPDSLSGGQQQRVALARALVKNPTVLLLDESLSALDEKLRHDMQIELKEIQETLQKTFIYVTHSQEEAITMADRIGVMDKGKLIQVGTPEHIYEEPKTRAVAEFIGETNFITGILNSKDEHFGEVNLPGGTLVGAVLDDPETPLEAEVTVAIRPEKISILPAHGKVMRNAMENSPLSPLYKKLEDMDEETGRRVSLSIKMEELVNLADLGEDTASIRGTVLRATYMGTDTRYTVSLAQTGFNLIVRVQNFERRFDTRFIKDQNVFIYWKNENARILRD